MGGLPQISKEHLFIPNLYHLALAKHLFAMHVCFSFFSGGDYKLIQISCKIQQRLERDIASDICGTSRHYPTFTELYYALKQ